MYVCVYGCNHILFPQVVVAHSSVFLKVFIYLSIYQSVFKVRLYAHERERETERARECALSLPTTARVSAAAAPVPLLTAGVDIVPEIAQKYGGDGSEFVLVDSFENEMAQ